MGLAQKHRSDQQVTQGIVLRTMPYGESDIILRLLTPGFGKIPCIARRARNSKKRFPSSLDLFDSGSFTIQVGRGELAVISDVTQLQSFSGVRSSLNKLVLASLLCETLDLLMLEHDLDSAAEYFELCELSMRALAESEDLKQNLRTIYVSLSFILERAGYLSRDQIALPSSRSLVALLNAIEKHADKKLMVRESVEDLINSLTA